MFREAVWWETEAQHNQAQFQVDVKGRGVLQEDRWRQGLGRAGAKILWKTLGFESSGLGWR